VRASASHSRIFPQVDRPITKLWAALFCMCWSRFLDFMAVQIYGDDSFSNSESSFHCNRGFPGCSRSWSSLAIQYKNMNMLLKKTFEVVNMISCCPCNGHILRRNRARIPVIWRNSEIMCFQISKWDNCRASCKIPLVLDRSQPAQGCNISDLTMP
jgi:hypothetical protein